MTQPPNSPRPLVLVVDDYQDAREMYAEYLEFSGFRVAEAKDGREAVDKAFALAPDVILMDLSLPVLDGWEATRLIKADARTQDAHFRYFNGDSTPAADQEHTHADGLYAAVNIPVDPDPEAVLRIEAWGRPSASDAEPIRLGCEAIRVFADAVTITNIGPERNDYPEGHPCAD